MLAFMSVAIGRVLGAHLLEQQSETAEKHTTGAGAMGGVGEGGPKRAAWVDDDDAAVAVDVSAKGRARKLRVTEDETVLEGAVYASRLEAQFEKIHAKPDWAVTQAEKGAGGGAEVGVLASTAKLLRTNASILPPGKLQCVRLRNANHASESKAVVQAAEFHPDAPVMITAGLDKTLRIFAVDGKENAVLQTVFFNDLPIMSAQFASGGNEVVLAGRCHILVIKFVICCHYYSEVNS
jgi:U3 small nucleolar RNA-associated protein 18